MRLAVVEVRLQGVARGADLRKVVRRRRDLILVRLEVLLVSRKRGLGGLQLHGELVPGLDEGVARLVVRGLGGLELGLLLALALLEGRGAGLELLARRAEYAEHARRAALRLVLAREAVHARGVHLDARVRDRRLPDALRRAHLQQRIAGAVELRQHLTRLGERRDGVLVVLVLRLEVGLGLAAEVLQIREVRVRLRHRIGVVLDGELLVADGLLRVRDLLRERRHDALVAVALRDGLRALVHAPLLVLLLRRRLLVKALHQALELTDDRLERAGRRGALDTHLHGGEAGLRRGRGLLALALAGERRRRGREQLRVELHRARLQELRRLAAVPAPVLPRLDLDEGPALVAALELEQRRELLLEHLV